MRFRDPTESDLEAAPRGASGGKSACPVRPTGGHLSGQGMKILGQPVNK